MRDGFVEFPRTYGNFNEQAIKTPSGKFELYSNTLEKLGTRSPARPRAAALRARGNRRHAGISADLADRPAREDLSPFALPRAGLGAQGIAGSDDPHSPRNRKPAWSHRWGLDLRRDRSRPGALPLARRGHRSHGADVVTTGIGWWRPEASGPEFAVLDINVNAALTYAGPMDPMSGSVDTRAVPCRLRAAPAAGAETGVGLEALV